MVTFVGAGPGAKDLITVRGQRLLEEADIVIYAGSLVNPKLLYGCKETCAVYNSAKMTLEEVLEVIKEGETQRKNIVRLHTGDPCLYGAIKGQGGKAAAGGGLAHAKGGRILPCGRAGAGVSVAACGRRSLCRGGADARGDSGCGLPGRGHLRGGLFPARAGAVACRAGGHRGGVVLARAGAVYGDRRGRAIVRHPQAVCDYQEKTIKKGKRI